MLRTSLTGIALLFVLAGTASADPVTLGGGGFLAVKTGCQGDWSPVPGSVGWTQNGSSATLNASFNSYESGATLDVDFSQLSTEGFGASSYGCVRLSLSEALSVVLDGSWSASTDEMTPQAWTSLTGSEQVLGVSGTGNLHYEGVLDAGTYTLCFNRSLESSQLYQGSGKAAGSLSVQFGDLPKPEVPQLIEDEQPRVQAVPEPGSLALLALAGLALVGGVRVPRLER